MPSAADDLRVHPTSTIKRPIMAMRGRQVARSAGPRRSYSPLV